MLAVSSHIPFLVAIRCLFDKWKLPFYSAMDYTLNKQRYQELLVHLYDIGLICKITCCDQGQFQYHQNQTNFLTFLYKNVSFDFSNTYAGYRVSLQVWNRLKKINVLRLRNRAMFMKKCILLKKCFSSFFVNCELGMDF